MGMIFSQVRKIVPARLLKLLEYHGIVLDRVKFHDDAPKDDAPPFRDATRWQRSVRVRYFVVERLTVPIAMTEAG